MGREKFYIACQAPLQNTVEDFWKMVWKEQTKVIIMLTGLTENGVVSNFYFYKVCFNSIG